MAYVDVYLDPQPEDGTNETKKQSAIARYIVDISEILEQDGYKYGGLTSEGDVMKVHFVGKGHSVNTRKLFERKCVRKITIGRD